MQTEYNEPKQSKGKRYFYESTSKDKEELGKE